MKADILENTNENVDATFRCGLVAILGPTNAGKSTLLNSLVGQKISIVSDKTQTTYHGIRGILTDATSQCIFVDTPGLQTYRQDVARLLNRVTIRHAGDCDVLVWVFDASRPGCLSQIRKMSSDIKKLKPASHSLLVLNKVDRIAKPALLPLLEQIHGLELFSALIPISAKKGTGTSGVLKAVRALLPVQKPVYGSNVVTDRGPEFQLTECVREKIYELTHQEIPYATVVELEGFADGKVPTYHATLHVDSDSKKGILIGKGGQMLKEIGIRARKDIEGSLGKKICLKLNVHVRPNWQNDDRFVHQYLELT